MTIDDWKHIKEATLAEESEPVWAYKQELADLIDAEIERQWIPVSERLPDASDAIASGDMVLAVDGDRRINITKRRYVCQGEFTHWMPLPKPPESEG